MLWDVSLKCVPFGDAVEYLSNDAKTSRQEREIGRVARQRE